MTGDHTLQPWRPRVIVFDAVGTLIHPKPSVAEAYEAVGRAFGTRLGSAEIGRRFREAFMREEAADRQLGWRTSETREQARWRQIVGRVLDDVQKPEDCFQALFEHFALPGSWECDGKTSEVLEELNRRGFRVAIASNFDRRLRGVLAELDVLANASTLVISSEIGWRKPSKEFFQEVCRQVEAPAEQILFVGDDPTNDIEPARAAGMHAWLLDPGQEAAPGSVPGLSVLLERL